MTALYEHMSWCQGTHDPDGECLIKHLISGTVDNYDEVSVQVLGVPCDHLSVDVIGIICDVDELGAVVAALVSVRPVLEARDADVNCDNHNHEDDPAPEDDEDEPLICEGCGQPAETGVQLVEGHGGYRCEVCCATLGVKWIDYP